MHVESAFDKRGMKGHNIVTNDAINTRKARPEMRGRARTQTIECTQVGMGKKTWVRSYMYNGAFGTRPARDRTHGIIRLEK